MKNPLKSKLEGMKINVEDILYKAQIDSHKSDYKEDTVLFSVGLNSFYSKTKKFWELNSLNRK